MPADTATVEAVVTPGDNYAVLTDGDGTLWAAGVAAYATSVGSPDVLQAVTPTTGLPVQPQTGSSWTVTNAGTFAVQAAQSGTWTVDLGATDNAVLDAIAASLATLDNTVSGNELQVDVLSSTLPSGASTSANQSTIIGHLDGVEGLLGTIDADTGTILTNTTTIASPVATIGTTPLMRIAIFDASNTQITSFGGGTQYTEGDTDASITGTAALWEDTSNTLRAASVAKPLPIQISDGTDVADIFDLSSSNPLAVALVDGSGTQITSFGGGTQYTEGDTDSSITGTAMLWEDTSDTLRAVSASKPLPVNIISGAGSGGTAIQDDTAFTVGTTNVTPVGGIYRSVLDSVNDGDAGALAMAANRILLVNITADDGSIWQPTFVREDLAASGSEWGNFVCAVRRDTPASGTSDDGDWASFNVDASGRLWTHDPVAEALLTTIDADTSVLANAVFVDDAAFTPGTSRLTVIGAQADEDSTDAVDEGDAGALRMTLERKLRVVAALDSAHLQSGNDQVVPKFAAIDAASSGDNTIVAAVASKKLRVLSAFLVSAGTVTVRFESGAGGTALTGQMNLVANSGFTLPFNPAGWFETASNTLLNIELSGAVSVDGCLTYIEVD